VQCEIHTFSLRVVSYILMHSVSVSQSGSPQNGMHSTSITRSRWGIPLIIIIVALLYNACLPTQAKMEKEQSSSKKTQKEKVKTKEQTSEKKTQDYGGEESLRIGTTPCLTVSINAGHCVACRQ